jgi:PilZ domain
MGGDLLGRFRAATAAAPPAGDLGVRKRPPKPVHATVPVINFERRRAPRRAPEQPEPLAHVRLRAGRELDVVNISDTGVLVDGAARLHPGAHVDVHVVTQDGRVLVRSRVVRAFVSHVSAEVVRYGGALAFEQTIDTAAAR